MIRTAALCCLITGPAWAESNATSVDVSIAAADGPHVAVVSMTNHYRHSPLFSQPFDLEVDGLHVQVTVYERHGTLPDTVTVDVPEGFVAVPRSIELAERQSGEILIYNIEGVGM